MLSSSFSIRQRPCSQPFLAKRSPKQCINVLQSPVIRNVAVQCARAQPKPDTCLICIDMQNDFCLSTSPLCVAGAMGCLPKVQEAIEIARAHKLPVIWVIREHDASGVDIEYTRVHLFKDGTGSTVPGTSGAALVEGLEVRPGELVMVKKRFSAFLHTHLDLMLRRLGVRRVVMCGVQTPNCVRASAVDSLGHDYETAVLSDATASKSPAVQEANLEDMRCMGIATPTVEEWAAALGKAAEAPAAVDGAL